MRLFIMKFLDKFILASIWLVIVTAIGLLVFPLNNSTLTFIYNEIKRHFFICG